jgi:hypothetical protein
MARSPSPADAQYTTTSTDTPDVGTRWEDPHTGDHYAVTDVGFKIMLEPCQGDGPPLYVDAREWPRQYVPEPHPDIDTSEVQG